MDCNDRGECDGDEFVEAVDDVVGDKDDEECGIDHGNMLGTLDLDVLNPCFEKCALQIRLLTVISVSPTHEV